MWDKHSLPGQQAWPCYCSVVPSLADPVETDPLFSDTSSKPGLQPWKEMLLELFLGCFKHRVNDPQGRDTDSCLECCCKLLSCWPGCNWVPGHLGWSGVTLLITMPVSLMAMETEVCCQANLRNLWGHCLFPDLFLYWENALKQQTGKNRHHLSSRLKKSCMIKPWSVCVKWSTAKWSEMKWSECKVQERYGHFQMQVHRNTALILI